MSSRLPSSPADLESRRRAIDVRRSAIVQAPAGSGKTELLTQRFLALLAIASHPDEIVAITFTRKAAAQMQRRIVRALEIAATGAGGEDLTEETLPLARAAMTRDREMKWELLRHPAQLRIQTIDALCLRLAQSVPLQAPVANNILDDASELYSEAARAAIGELAGNDAAIASALRCVLLHLDGDSATFRLLLSEMLGRRDQWQRHIPAHEDAVQFRKELEVALARAIRRSLDGIRRAFPAHLAAQVPALARFAASHGNAIAGLEQVGALRELPGADVADASLWQAVREFLQTDKHWRKAVNVSHGFPPRSPEKLQMQALLAACAAQPELRDALIELEYLPPDKLNHSQWEVAEALFRILPCSVEHLASVFAEHDVTDFGQLTQAALVTTQHRPGHAGFRHLLVDEYQDTSLTQQKLFASLVADWQPDDGRTLFLVGDPMQSIYRFRQAEVAVFLETWKRQRLGQVILDPLRLSVNFRSGPQIVDWVNETFARVFGPSDAGRGAVEFTHSTAQHRIAGPQVRIVPEVQFGQNHFSDADGTPDEREARQIAGHIATERNRNPQARIAVLVRAREHLARIVPQLGTRNIPFTAIEIVRLGDTQIVRDLLALTRALLHPADRIAWLAVLRAPWCGLDLGDLELMCGQDKRSCLPELIQGSRSTLSAEAQSRLARVMAVLEASCSGRGRRSLAPLVEGAWIALGGPACIAADDRPNAEAFLRVLDELESGGDIADWQRLQARLTKLFAQHASSHPNPVQLMTIHKAKGLEFDVVLVPGLGKPPQRSDEQLLRWIERNTEDGPELLLAPAGPKGGDTDALFRFLGHIDHQCDDQEIRRLAYVAATRARDSLYLLGCAKAKVEANGEVRVSAHAGSLLKALWPAVGAHFEQAAAAQVAKPEVAAEGIAIAASAHSASPLFRRLPLDWKFPAGPPPIRQAPLAEVPHPEPVTFEWASDFRRQVGVVIHTLLQCIAVEGVERWDAAAIASAKPKVANALAQEGVPRPEIPSAAAEVLGALKFAISDPRGRWCLARHELAESELELTGLVGGTPQHIRVDRSFVDAGVRWIVDFKTGWREGGGRESFLDNEVERYREQLERYAELVRSFDPRPVRIGIFFPIAGGWREWEPRPKSSSAGAP